MEGQFVTEIVATGADDRALRRDPRLVRVRRGVYVDRSQLEASASDERYDLLIRAVLGTRRSPLVLSHLSAARMHSLPIADPWPHAVHATVPPDSARRTKNGVVIHRHHLDDGELVEFDGILATSLLRTVVDVARSASFRNAVTLLDAALHSGATDRETLGAALASRGVAPGSNAARRAVEFASPLSESVGESASRVLMHELRFPPPELQHEFSTREGTRFADFWWDDLRLVGEFDGFSKYTDEPTSVIWREKTRENALRELGLSIVRWAWADLADPARFARRLESAGLRRARPRGYSARSGR